MQEANYRALGGRLSVVLDTIRRLKKMGFWVEVVTLVVPGFNDSVEELRDTARFLVSVSEEIPWHVTAFHRDYRMTDPGDTPPEALIRAAEVGRKEGLQFVYAGNVPGRVGGWENTTCPGCGSLLVERFGYRILRNRLEHGSCPDCHRPIPGVWESSARLELPRP
jgi:pyruvate formate lyase activating enzyme